ncbi:MAG: hypothetical protein ACM3QS_18075 [Bacteroidota bacterium]
MTLFGKLLGLSRDRSGILSHVVVPSLIMLGLAARYLGLYFVSGDMSQFLLPWYETLAAGGFQALRESFYNYTPPYMDLMALAAGQSIIPGVLAIKLISIFFDICNAFLVYRILRIKYPQGALPLAGAAAFWVLPTVLLNSAVWGQADAVYTFFLLASLYFLMQDRPLPAMLLLGISFSIKAQAVFLAPLLLLLIVRKKVPWYYVGLVPLMYVVMVLPVVFAGRPLMELLTVYVSQAGKYRSLSMHAPNLYVFISNRFYTPAVIIGMALTLFVVLAWVIVYARRREKLIPDRILLYALASVVLLPFFLPKMHDRYFYPADVLSFLVAFYFPSLSFLALCYQAVSMLVYSIFLLPSLGPMPHGVPQAILNTAAILNTVTILILLWSQWRLRQEPQPHLTPDT